MAIPKIEVEHVSLIFFEAVRGGCGCPQAAVAGTFSEKHRLTRDLAKAVIRELSRHQAHSRFLADTRAHMNGRSANLRSGFDAIVSVRSLPVVIPTPISVASAAVA